MKYKITSLFACGIAVAVLAGCGGSGSAAPSDAASAGSAESGITTITDGTLTIGLSPDFPPLEYMDGEKLVGADIDLINEIASRLGLEVKVEEQKFDQIINSVRTDRVDVAISGMSDTVERQQTVDFVDYFKSSGQFYTLPELAGQFTKDTDLCGASVAVSTKTDYYPALQTMSSEICESAGLEPISLVGTDSGAAARLQLDQGRAQVAVQGNPNLAYFQTTEPGKYQIVLANFAESSFGILVKKGNTELAEALQEVLQEMYNDGTTERILAQYGLGDSVMEPVINGVKA